MRRVDPYPLWIGHAGDGRAFGELFAREIRAVVQVAAEEPPIALPREFLLIRIPLLDGGGNDIVAIRLAVNSVAGLVRDAVETLVCCGAGMSRSPAIAAAALSVVEGTEPEVCLRRVTNGYPADVSSVLWDEVVSILKAL